eukprot:PhM_4_TR11615/c0_g1_i1/m.9848
MSLSLVTFATTDVRASASTSRQYSAPSRSHMVSATMLRRAIAFALHSASTRARSDGDDRMACAVDTHMLRHAASRRACVGRSNTSSYAPHADVKSASSAVHDDVSLRASRAVCSLSFAPVICCATSATSPVFTRTADISDDSTSAFCCVRYSYVARVLLRAASLDTLTVNSTSVLAPKELRPTLLTDKRSTPSSDAMSSRALPSYRPDAGFNLLYATVTIARPLQRRAGVGLDVPAGVAVGVAVDDDSPHVPTTPRTACCRLAYVAAVAADVLAYTSMTVVKHVADAVAMAFKDVWHVDGHVVVDAL